MKKYILVWDKGAYSIQTKVTKEIESGYICQGGIFYNDSDGYFYQAMIKK